MRPVLCNLQVHGGMYTLTGGMHGASADRRELGRFWKLTQARTGRREAGREGPRRKAWCRKKENKAPTLGKVGRHGQSVNHNQQQN